MINKNDNRTDIPKVPLQKPSREDVGGSVNIPSYEKVPNKTPDKKNK